MEIEFSGKTALVTGASKGIGRHIALELAKCKAKVFALARSESLLDMDFWDAEQKWLYDQCKTYQTGFWKLKGP